jgi:hypothetical protein
MKLAAHKDRMEEMEEKLGVYTILVENIKTTDNLGDPGIDGRIILKYILFKENVKCGLHNFG